MKTTTNANVLQTSESKVKKNWQNMYCYLENVYGVDLTKVYFMNSYL
jgi:hypothetical protein